jgi:hypothetical protein
MKSVGVFELGYENVELFIKDKRGGSFQFTPESQSLPRIIVGGSYTKWQDVYTVLVHETVEFALTRGACRYSESQDLSNDTAAFVFMFNHSQFADACAKAAEFMVACHQPLHRAWVKHKIKFKIGKPEMVKVDRPISVPEPVTQESFETEEYAVIPPEISIVNTS